jgi:putative nucleotidyltransferase with HDIG domain
MKKKNDNIISIPNLVNTVMLVNLCNELEEKREKAKSMALSTAKAFLCALEMKDEYTFGHSARVAHYSKALGKELGLTPEELEELELAALFHDIGKIGIPDNVLNKPTRLDENEFNIMKSHPEKSGIILEELKFFKNLAPGAKYHHERYDGRGYPEGLKGDAIPLAARVILIADTFDAMTSTRPYRKGLAYEIAFEELREFSGSQFDPILVEKFIIAMEKDKKKGDLFTISLYQKPFSKQAA